MRLASVSGKFRVNMLTIFVRKSEIAIFIVFLLFAYSNCSISIGGGAELLGIVKQNQISLYVWRLGGVDDIIDCIKRR